MEEQGNARGDKTQGLNQAPPLISPPKSSPQPNRSADTRSFREGFNGRYWTGNTSKTNPPPNTKRRALVIAIAYGRRSPPNPLEGTYADAYRIIDLLVNKFGYPKSEILVLSDIVIVNKDGKDDSRYPNKSNIKQSIEWLIDGSKEDDFRFLFFAEHGCRRIEQSVPRSDPVIFEGIVPADVDFQPYRTCEDCICELQTLNTRRNLVAHPGLIIWDYELNEWLTTSLTNGSHLTVVFDCCHSGGTLRKSMPEGDDVLTAAAYNNARGRNMMATILSFAFGVLGISETGSSSKDIPSKNLIGLPKVIDLEADKSFDTEQSRCTVDVAHSRSTLPRKRDDSTIGIHETAETEENACYTHREFQQDNFKKFGPNSRIMCWAGCWDHQYAYENNSLQPVGGRFTTEFVDHLSKNPESTYRELNRAINNAFRAPFCINQDQPRVFQRPQLYTSANMGSGDEEFNKFEQKIEM